MLSRTLRLSGEANDCPRRGMVTLLTAAVLCGPLSGVAVAQTSSSSNAAAKAPLTAPAPLSSTQTPPEQAVPATPTAEAPADKPPSGAVPVAPAPLTTPPPTPVVLPVIADPVNLPPAEVVYTHPLSKPMNSPAKLLERPKPNNFEGRAMMYVTVHLSPAGAPLEAIAVEPPLRAIAPSLGPLWPKWKFTPAMKAGSPVSTWATYGIEMEFELEKPLFSGLLLTPVGKDDPLPVIANEALGDAWMQRYPREVNPADGSVSVEDVDVLPAPQKTKWDYDSARVRSRFTGLLLVNGAGKVTKLVPTAASEPLMAAWFRQMTAQWKLTPAMASGQAVESWLELDVTVDYEVSTAKERGKRSAKKNLRGPPG